MSAEISIFLGPLQNLLSWFQKERHFKDEKKDAALQAMNKAIIATKRYMKKVAVKNALTGRRNSSFLSCGQTPRLRHATQAVSLPFDLTTRQLIGLIGLSGLVKRFF